jgi:VWFA-related protein
MFQNKVTNKSLVCSILIILIFFSFSSPSFAQNPIYFQITWVESSLYPTVQVYLSVSDASGLQISGLDRSLFTVETNGQVINDFQLQEITNAKFPLSIVLAIDTSGSMEAELDGVTALENAVTAAKSFMDQLNPDDQVGIVSFADEVMVAQGLTTDLNAAKSALDSLIPGGETKLYDAVVQSVDLLNGVQSRKLVVFLTDGKDSGTSENTLEDVISAAGTAGVPVFPIGFGNINTDRLASIAEETGGFAQFPEDSSTIQGGFSTILNLLRRQLLLTFESELPADGSSHDIQVTLNYQGADNLSQSTFLSLPYSISIDNPADGEQFSDPVDITVSITPSERTKSVDFLLDGESFSIETTAPFTASMPIDPQEYGEHLLSVVAQDINGISTENSITIITRPAILLSFTSHQEGDLLRGSPTIEVESDNLYDLTELRLLIDGEVFETFEGPPYLYEWPLYNVVSGEYQLSVEAVDVNGNTANVEILVEVRSSGGDADLPGTDYTLYIILGAIAVLTGVLIPLGIRRRKKAGLGTSTGEAELVEIRGRSPNKHWPLQGEEIRLGRQANDNEIPLEGMSASRRMAVIRPSEEGYIIYTLVAENPVIVNGSPIPQQHILQPGDILILGESEFRFQLSQE